METVATPAKKGSGLGIVLVIVLALGIGTTVAYLYRKKGSSGGGEAGDGAAQKTVAPDSPESGYTAESQARFAEHRIANSKVALTDAQKQAIRDNPTENVQLSAEQAAQLKEHKTKKITGQMQNDTGDIAQSSFYENDYK